MSYPILPQQQSQTSLVPAVTKDSCILQGLPVTCYIQAPCTHGAAIPVSRCPTSPYSEPHPSTSSTAAPYYYYNNGNRGSTEYTKVMDAPTWVVSPSTVFSSVHPDHRDLHCNICLSSLCLMQTREKRREQIGIFSFWECRSSWLRSWMRKLFSVARWRYVSSNCWR